MGVYHLEYRLNSSVSASRVTLTWKQSYRANFKLS